MVGVMVTSSKRTYVSLPCLPELLQSVPVTPQQATHTSTGDSWTGEASLAQSLVGPRLLSPGSWCTRFSLCPPRVSISPVLWKFCKQIPLAFKVKFPVGSQSLCPLFEKEKWFALYFLGLHNHYRRWLQHDIKRHLLLGRKAMTNPDSILRSRDITLLTKVHIVKAMVFVVVMDGCESWTIKKAEHWRMDVFELWCCRRLLRVPWNCKEIQPVSILKEISPEYSLEGLMLKLKPQYFGQLMGRADSLEKPWCWERRQEEKATTEQMG